MENAAAVDQAIVIDDPRPQGLRCYRPSTIFAMILR